MIFIFLIFLILVLWETLQPLKLFMVEMESAKDVSPELHIQRFHAGDMMFFTKHLVQGYLLPKPWHVNVKGTLQRLLVFDEEMRESSKNLKWMFLNIGSMYKEIINTPVTHTNTRSCRQTCTCMYLNTQPLLSIYLYVFTCSVCIE